jgi:hypothetical protein
LKKIIIFSVVITATLLAYLGTDSDDILVHDKDLRVYVPSRLSIQEYFALGDKEESRPILSRIKGVYTYRFDNENMDGTKYESVDKITVFPVDDYSAFVAIELFGFNGHGCIFNGVLTYTPVGDYMYRSPNRECALTMRVTANRIVLNLRTEENHCFCGSRMGLRDYSMSLTNIQDSSLLSPSVNSEEYAEAISAYSSFLRGLESHSIEKEAVDPEPGRIN